MVSDRDPEKLRYLGKIGLFPNIEIEVIDKAPFNGPVHIRLSEISHHLGRELAQLILVDRVERQAQSAGREE
jgi:DtxR family Mn-dependent transcriptional regulator